MQAGSKPPCYVPAVGAKLIVFNRNYTLPVKLRVLFDDLPEREAAFLINSFDLPNQSTENVRKKIETGKPTLRYKYVAQLRLAHNDSGLALAGLI